MWVVLMMLINQVSGKMGRLVHMLERRESTQSRNCADDETKVAGCDDAEL